MTRMGIGSRVLINLVLLLAAATAGASERFSAGVTPSHSIRETPFVVRPFAAIMGTRWIGEAIGYGPYRDGQFPGGPGPRGRRCART